MNDLLQILQVLAALQGQPNQVQPINTYQPTAGWVYVDPNPQTCGWTEQRMDGGDRWIYVRVDGCYGTVIGQRWEKKIR